MFMALLAYARHNDLRRGWAEDADMKEAIRKLGDVAVGYLVTIAVSLLVPVAAVGLFGGGLLGSLFHVVSSGQGWASSP
jgi:hypothetical protein